jgi:hypothetical protein
MSQRVLYFNSQLMPRTAALLRAVFGWHTVPLQQVPVTALGAPTEFTHMEAALAGVDYVKLLLAGNTKVPVLTLVGAPATADLFLRWLHEVIDPQVDIRHASDLAGILQSSAKPGLVVAEADCADGLFPLMNVLNSAADVCLNPGPAHLHEHVVVKANFCVLSASPIDPALLHATHWLCEVQELVPDLVRPDAIDALRAEYRYVLTMMYHKPFLTKPSGAWWFGPEILNTPKST